jgi:hypothetical protein
MSQPSSFPRKTQLSQDIKHNDIKNNQKRADHSSLPLRTVEVDKMKISEKTTMTDASVAKQLAWYPTSIKEAHKMGKTLMPNKGN